jgi:hypothetical protein
MSLPPIIVTPTTIMIGTTIVLKTPRISSSFGELAGVLPPPLRQFSNSGCAEPFS